MLVDSTKAPIYLVGAVGVPNYGDELIMGLWLRFLALTQPRCPVWVDGIDAGVAATLLNGLHPRVRVTSTLWQTAARVAEAELATQELLADRFVRHRGTPRADAGLDVVARAHRIHLVGGGYVNSLWETNTLLPVLAAKVNAAFGVPLAATGLGLTPLTRVLAKRVGRALADFEVAESRDENLSEELAASGVKAGFDDAFLGFHPRLAALTANRRPDPPPRYMLLLQGDLVPDHQRSQVLALALAELRRAGWTTEPLGVVEALPPDDAWVRGELEKGGIGHVFFSFLDLWRNGLPFADDQYWVSSRFHFHLLAAGAGISGTAISISSDYYAPKHRSLTSLGTGWRVVDLDGVEMAAAQPEATAAFPQLCRDIATRKWALAEQLYPSRWQRWLWLGRKGLAPLLGRYRKRQLVPQSAVAAPPTER